jgi:hypothetical protein
LEIMSTVLFSCRVGRGCRLVLGLGAREGMGVGLEVGEEGAQG